MAKFKWFICNECGEWEMKLEVSMVDFEDEVVCDYCFEDKANVEGDEIDLMIMKCLKDSKCSRPPMRRKK